MLKHAEDSKKSASTGRMYGRINLIMKNISNERKRKKIKIYKILQKNSQANKRSNKQCMESLRNDNGWWHN